MAQPGAGEQAAGEVVLLAGGAQAGDGAAGFILGDLAGGPTLEAVGVEGAAGEAQVAEGDAVEPFVSFRNWQRLSRALRYLGAAPGQHRLAGAVPGGALGCGEQQVAIAEAR